MPRRNSPNDNPSGQSALHGMRGDSTFRGGGVLVVQSRSGGRRTRSPVPKYQSNWWAKIALVLAAAAMLPAALIAFGMTCDVAVEQGLNDGFGPNLLGFVISVAAGWWCWAALSCSSSRSANTRFAACRIEPTPPLGHENRHLLLSSAPHPITSPQSLSLTMIKVGNFHHPPSLQPLRVSKCPSRKSSSSAGPTSASRACSTGWPGRRIAIVDDTAGVTRDRVTYLMERQRPLLRAGRHRRHRHRRHRQPDRAGRGADRDGHRLGRRDPVRRRYPRAAGAARRGGGPAAAVCRQAGHLRGQQGRRPSSSTPQADEFYKLGRGKLMQRQHACRTATSTSCST